MHRFRASEKLALPLALTGLLFVLACSLHNSRHLVRAMGTAGFKKIVHKDSGKCLDIAFDNNELILFECTGDYSQYWHYNHRGSGHLESKSQEGMCISYAPNDGIQLADCDKSESSWNYKDFMFALRSRPGLCLDNYLNQNENYNKLLTLACWPAEHKLIGEQKWILA